MYREVTLSRTFLNFCFLGSQPLFKKCWSWQSPLLCKNVPGVPALAELPLVFLAFHLNRIPTWVGGLGRRGLLAAANKRFEKSH